MVTILLVLSWILASVTEGARDGFYYHHWNTSTNQSKKDIHFIFTIERTIIGLAHTVVYWKMVDSNLYHDFFFGLSLMLIFSWFHNGMYLSTREFLQKGTYPKKWKDDSTTSIAKGEFSYEVRSKFAIIGAIILIWIQLP